MFRAGTKAIITTRRTAATARRIPWRGSVPTAALPPVRPQPSRIQTSSRLASSTTVRSSRSSAMARHCGHDLEAFGQAELIVCHTAGLARQPAGLAPILHGIEGARQLAQRVGDGSPGSVEISVEQRPPKIRSAGAPPSSTTSKRRAAQKTRRCSRLSASSPSRCRPTCHARSPAISASVPVAQSRWSTASKSPRKGAGEFAGQRDTLPRSPRRDGRQSRCRALRDRRKIRRRAVRPVRCRAPSASRRAIGPRRTWA